LSSAGASISNAVRYNIGTPKVVNIWVDPVKGSDSNSGATRALALATLEAAWNRIPERTTLTTTGYRIMLSAGSYRERMPPNGWMESRYGTYQCPIIIQSADGVGAARLSNVDMFNCHYTYLIGVQIEASGAESGDALHLAGCNHILVRQVQAIGTGDISSYASPQEALKANQCQYLYVEDSDISGAWSNALDYVAVQYGHIAGSRIHHSLDWCVCLKGGSASLLIEGNKIYDSSTGGFTAGQGTAFEYMVSPWLHYEAYDIKFINNLIYDIDGASGVGVQGGYNILLAYNTLYRVGKTDNTMEFVHGLRGCGAGDSAKCAANLKAGGWGTVRTGWENQQPIPNRNVFVYNNIVYNPPGYQTQWQQFAFSPPQTPASDSNIPSPSRADTNLQIWGNIIWNGPSDMSLSGDYIPSTPTCSATQLVRDNTINTLKPQLVDPAHGNFQPVKGGNVFTAKVFPIPRFTGGDRPQPPLAPQGDLSNTVMYDYDGMPRTSPSPPGAFIGTVKKPTTFTVATSKTTPTKNVPFTLSGTLKSGTAPLINQPVHLERRTGTTGTWANVANTFKLTNSTGKVVVSQKMATAGTYQFRWHFNGTATYQGAYSAALTETVKA
jgi:hypothetical protein